MTDVTTGHRVASALAKTEVPIRLGIVGGGGGAFIGPVHALAARMDNRYELFAGALSSRPKHARIHRASVTVFFQALV